MMKLTPVRAGLFSAILAVGAAQAATSVKPVKAPAENDTLRLRYAISLIGLPLGSASVSGTLGSGKYRIEANAKLTGLAGVIVNSKGAATATGTIGGDHQVPATFAVRARRSSRKHKVKGHRERVRSARSSTAPRSVSRLPTGAQALI